MHEKHSMKSKEKMLKKVKLLGVPDEHAIELVEVMEFRRNNKHKSEKIGGGLLINRIAWNKQF